MPFRRLSGDPPELLGRPVRFHRLLQQAPEGHPRPRPLHLHERVRGQPRRPLRLFEFLSASSIWCHPVISSDIWFPLCKGKIHASTNNNLKYPRFFDAFFLYSVFSVWTAQMEIGGMFRRDAGQNAPLLRHKTKGKSRIMNQNQAKEYYKKLFVNYPDVLSVEEATTLLGFKSQTAIIRRIHQHRIRCLKVGRSFMIPKEYLIDYLLDS